MPNILHTVYEIDHGNKVKEEENNTMLTNITIKLAACQFHIYRVQG